MQSFIRHIIGSDERIIVLARLHWIYLVMGALWLVVLAGIGLVLDFFLWVYFGSSVPLAAQELFGFRISAKTPVMLILFGGCGVVVFLQHLIKKMASEIALTNHRLIYKTGLIFVEVEELDLAEIRAERVHHGMLGRFLGYGRLQMDSRFIGDVRLPAVKRPYRLLKAMHTVRAKLHDPLAEESNILPKGAKR